uniref:Jacalin-type lectin domain-containing protein n=1 Tax=Phytophthora ramorum TaxID=164328 RepID=H3GZL6_PHYRM
MMCSLSEAFGGPHGTKYSDIDLAAPGQTVKSVTTQAGERVNGVGIEITDPSGVSSELYHGGKGCDPNKLTLSDGEYITGVEAHWGEKGDHTFILFTTSANHTIEGGNPTKNFGVRCWFSTGSFVMSSLRTCISNERAQRQPGDQAHEMAT